MSYGAARAFGTARVMHICSRYAAVSVANTSLYWEPYSSDSYVPWLCYADMLRSIDISRSYFSSAPLFFIFECLRFFSKTCLDRSSSSISLGQWRPPARDSFSMALAHWNCPELLSILPSSSVPIMGSFGYDPRNRDPRVLDTSGPRP